MLFLELYDIVILRKSCEQSFNQNFYIQKEYTYVLLYML